MFHGTWETKDESENFAQKYDGDIVKKDKRREVESEVGTRLVTYKSHSIRLRRSSPIFSRRNFET